MHSECCLHAHWVWAALTHSGFLGLTVLLQHELSAGVYSVLIRLQPETPFSTLKTLQFYLLRIPLCPLLLLPTCTLQSPACCFTLSAVGWGDLVNLL